MICKWNVKILSTIINTVRIIVAETSWNFYHLWLCNAANWLDLHLKSVCFVNSLCRWGQIQPAYAVIWYAMPWIYIHPYCFLCHKDRWIGTSRAWVQYSGCLNEFRLDQNLNEYIKFCFWWEFPCASDDRLRGLSLSKIARNLKFLCKQVNKFSIIPISGEQLLL